LPEEGVEFVARGFKAEELPPLQVFPGRGFSDSEFGADFEGTFIVCQVNAVMATFDSRFNLVYQ
jgi:hypothetical protein